MVVVCVALLSAANPSLTQGEEKLTVVTVVTGSLLASTRFTVIAAVPPAERVSGVTKIMPSLKVSLNSDSTIFGCFYIINRCSC